MKNKNIILIAVAVGCGLVAAFVTARLGAKPAVQAETVDVPVAARDLPVGTKLNKDDINNLVTYKKFPKDSAPMNAVDMHESLMDKRLVRTIRAGEAFNVADLTDTSPISPPPGFNMMTFNATLEKAVAGFAGPGSKVDIIASVRMQSQGGKSVVFPLLIDMLVLAIDNQTQFASTGAYQQLGTVSLAVNSKQALLLHGALGRTADLRLVLRNTDRPSIWAPGEILTEEAIWKILADEPEKQKVQEEPKTPKGPEMVKLPVPIEDLPAGTALTKEVIETKFKLVDFTPPAPSNVVSDLKEHTGKYTTKDIAANTFVPRSFVGEKPVVIAELPKVKPAPNVDGSPKAPLVDPTPKVIAKPAVYWDTTVQTAGGMKKYRYQKLDNGEYKFLGELKDEGQPEAAKAEDAPDAKPKDEKNPADKPI